MITWDQFWAMAGVLLGFAVVLIGAFWGFVVWYGKRIEKRLDTRADALQERWADIAQNQADLMPVLLNFAQQIEHKEFGNELTLHLSGIAAQSIKRERTLRNPLSNSEIDELEGYLSRTQTGEWLNLQEARRFDELARRMQADRKLKGETDVGAAVIATAAAFILWWLLNKSGK